MCSTPWVDTCCQRFQLTHVPCSSLLFLKHVIGHYDGPLCLIQARDKVEVDSDIPVSSSVRTAECKNVLVDSDRPVSSSVRTAECKNVLVDMLGLENFAFICNVLRKSVYQEEERTRYFDFGVTESRMKNGEYGCWPEIFKDDLKLVITSQLFSSSIFFVNLTRTRTACAWRMSLFLLCCWRTKHSDGNIVDFLEML